MIIHNRRRFYQEYKGPHELYSESKPELPIIRCRTSNPSVFHSVSNGRVRIFEDVRYYEYVAAVGSGFFDLYNQKYNVNIPSRNVVTVLAAFAREVLMDSDPEYAIDIVYLDILAEETKNFFSDIKKAMDYKCCSSWSELFLRDFMSRFIIQHEISHFRRYIGIDEAYSKPMIELMEFSRKIVGDKYLFPLKRYTRSAKHTYNYIMEHFEKVEYFDEILCDLRAGRKALIYTVNTYVNSHGGSISESRFNSIVAAFIAMPHIIKMIELTRLNTFEETPSEEELIKWNDLFNGRKAFLILMICKMIHEKEIFVPDDYDIVDRVIKIEDFIKKITWTLVDSIKYCISSKMIRSIHKNIKGDMLENGYSVDRCLDLVRKNWAI